MPFASRDGVEIWWEERGAGSPLLMVMGFGNSSALWGPLADALAQDFRVILVDNRGTGRSDRPAGPYTVPEMAADALAVLDDAGIDKATVFGVSLGGVIAQQIAITDPDRVSGLVLGCTTCPAHSESGSRVALSLLLLGAFLPPPVTRRLMRPYTYSARTPLTTIAGFTAVRKAAAASRRTVWRQASAGMFETCSRIGSLDTPTLVIHGSDDRLIPVSNGRRLAELIPGAAFVELANAGHMFFLEHPDATVAAVREHLLARGASAQ
jgi:3-oxoadipate enol-lactonase